ncbi:CPBP family intramembrane glutamic endopeptidase [Natronococcus sp. A-GB7]|uniref:CPBP family intramembrane glutamic endopeptidase n=1 Tax=Natronococcus sp. A-GB7 TaxID=3037649 RepID=UPI00241FEAB0|nr:CPBP family intramembrane glutamic endopeptidase [Natronococcus sp. A-GB7]MDG5820565.1 CPBP family intramembrane metalloprotease [Natronococcus sp. A-GB7]
MNARLQKLARSHQLTLFLLLTLGFSWGVYGIEFVSDSSLPPIAVYGPIIAAAIVTWLTGGNVRQWGRQLFIWRTSGRWYLIVLVGFPVVLVGGSTAIYVALTGDTDGLAPGVLPERMWIVLLFLAYQILTAGLGEELGWRGFALPRLQDRYNALLASLIIGVFWALWHFPLFFQPDSFQAQMGPIIYLMDGLTLSILFTWVYNSTGGSVLMAALLHGVYNTTLVLYPYEGELDIAEFPYLLGVSRTVLLLVIAVLILAVYGRDLTSKESIPGREHAGGVPVDRPHNGGTVHED